MKRTAATELLALLVLLAGVASTSARSPAPADPATPAALPTPPVQMREVILVRHGHYAPDPAIDERTGPGLSPIGVAQARLAGARLRADLPRIDGFLVSPMQRARDTAASIGQAFPSATFEVVADAAECTPPTRRAEIMAQSSPESAASCKAQLDRLFARLFERDDTAGVDVLVAHGNVTRYLVTRALGVGTEAWLEMSVGHASITRIRVEADGRYKVIAVGDVGHIPASLRTGASGDPERTLSPDAVRVREPARAGAN